MINRILLVLGLAHASAAEAVPLAPSEDVRQHLADPASLRPELLLPEAGEPAARVYVPLKALELVRRDDGALQLAVAGTSRMFSVSATVRSAHPWRALAAAVAAHKKEHGLERVELAVPAILAGEMQLAMLLPHGESLAIGRPVRTTTLAAATVVGGLVGGREAAAMMSALASGDGILTVNYRYRMAAKGATRGERIELEVGASMPLNGYCESHPESFHFNTTAGPVRGCLAAMARTPVSQPLTEAAICELLPDLCTQPRAQPPDDELAEFCRLFPSHPRCAASSGRPS